MSRAGIGRHRSRRLRSEAGGRPDAHLDPEEAERRAREKWDELVPQGLLPDWFLSDTGIELCVPADMRVAVIGGGFAGAAAAWYLGQCGIDTTLYEASGRIGGRVQTDRSFVRGGIVEAGAELIGLNHSMWNVLARRLTPPLTLVPITDDDEYEDPPPGRPRLEARLILGGHQLTPAEKDTLFANLDDSFKDIGDDARRIPQRRPWRHPLARVLDGMSVQDKLDLMLPLSSFERSWFEYTISNDNCAPVDAQSYLGLLALVSAGRLGDDEAGMNAYWDFTETHRCAEGNQVLAQRLAATISDVRLNTPVTEIDIKPWYPKAVRVYSSHAGAATTHEHYDYAILTAPPTVWGDIDFSFPAPSGRSIQHGPAVKFLSRYDTRFWEAAGLAPSTKDDSVGSLWEGTDAQPSVEEFDLSIFAGGPLVRPASAYPGMMARLYPTGAHTAQRFVNWPATPRIMTGYAVPGVGEVTTISRHQLRPHLWRLFFAGEQTSIGFFGYMEGALQSGARAARDVIISEAVPCIGFGV